MFIIAEAGTSHQGSLEKAYKLIEKAAWAGADCVKFQVVYADEIIHPLSGKVKLPGGNISLYEKFKEFEKNENFFQKLKQEAEKSGLVFLATPFGVKSARMLKNIGVSAIKIASPELNHYPLLEEAASYNLALILSGGVSALSDIERAVEITGRDITFLHAITAYPAPEEEYNLALIQTLSAIFGFKTGVSDHSTDPLLVPLISAALGATTLEKHFTLDNSGGGLDDLIALNPDNFKLMVSEIRSLFPLSPSRECTTPSSGAASILRPASVRPSLHSETFGGFNNSDCWQSLAQAGNSRLNELKKRFGEEKVNRIIGSGIKELAPSEKDNYKTTNRSLIALRKIDAGETIRAEDFAALRSEKNLLPGLGPEYAKIITGKTVKKQINNGAGITFEYFM
ncbi:MAG: N-acetylneuraminate synthase family protein [Spirochaetes bacterium]|nr:N-acetylneuraminate synthase family protein [Spirochaetota bacterium]